MWGMNAIFICMKLSRILLLTVFSWGLQSFGPGALAQTGIGEDREIIYPTEYDVRRGEGSGNIPIAVPSGFATRRTGSSIGVQAISVTGRVSVTKGADGKQIATLLPKGSGQPINVATGTFFKYNGHVLHAQGFDGNYYIVVDRTTGKTYRFAWQK